MQCIRELERHLRSINTCYSQAPVFPIACEIDHSMARNCHLITYRFQNSRSGITLEVFDPCFIELLRLSSALPFFGSSPSASSAIIASEAFWPILSEAPRHERIALMPELPTFSARDANEPTQELQVEVLEVHRGWLGLYRDHNTKDKLRSFFHFTFDLRRRRLNDALAGRPTIGYGAPVSQVLYGTIENDIEPITEEAKEKAWDLFKSHLTPEQLRDFERTKSISCIGNSTGDLYKINCNNNRNFNITTKNNVLCFQPEGDLPLGDFYLAQKLAIECNEDEVLRVCNWMMPDHLFLGDLSNVESWEQNPNTGSVEFNRNMLGSIEVDRDRPYLPSDDLPTFLLVWFCTVSIALFVISMLKLWGIM